MERAISPEPEQGSQEERKKNPKYSQPITESHFYPHVMCTWVICILGRIVSLPDRTTRREEGGRASHPKRGSLSRVSPAVGAGVLSQQASGGTKVNVRLLNRALKKNPGTSSFASSLFPVLTIGATVLSPSISSLHPPRLRTTKLPRTAASRIYCGPGPLILTLHKVKDGPKRLETLEI